MRLAFVLPAPVRVPQGGAAVVFRHATGLAALGHDVDVIAPKRSAGALAWARRMAVIARDRLHGVADARAEVPGVRVIEPSTAADIDGAGYDAVIATGWQTARWVAALRGGRRFYFLQGDERVLDPRAQATWALPLRKLAVARWLAGTVEAHGHAVEGLVPNAVDPEEMFVVRPPAQRGRCVMALYHRHPTKGPDTLVAALDALRQQVPDVAATLVAARPPSHRLPEWVDLHVRPSRDDLRTMYNEAAVCLHTSRLEGWGLVPMEAAACGCAIVATASRGPREFLSPGESMVEVAVGDAEGIASEAARLLRDPDERIRLALAGHAAVSRFSWVESTARLERLLRS
ncbi:glycosyltransferase family 4 protein [Rubrivirga sp. IMCC45206]|uniref:glycosyltransferase family 4 protein n=1 Tax=Rubrivirga sp. IMCC45206 TaxID=3391614 RepID=UPI00398F9A20